MPGLIRGVARTAVVAGTATAVSNRVTRRQQGRWAAQQQYASTYDAPAPRPTPAPEPPAGSAAPAMADRIEQLKQLGELKAQGVLTETEFEEQKRRLLEA
ncbi:SHOCT domain-containing protein [Streptomyces scabiei]|uniref:SHOCT domain-containing protein n=1 Tax=Streptomyces scabiei TaxID=1930 RepID=UPI0029AB8312|nr:SHOCT domain-containing protein [Streptomyces scabiei]MDX3520236.1 SHOCT domain-containing protein [Streptomyces scabiei]